MQEYEQFGGDPDWRWLETSLSNEGFGRLLKSLMQDRRTELLQRVACWKQRTGVPIAERRKVAKLAGGTWAGCCCWERLLDGAAMPEIPDIPAGEREILRAELDQIIRERANAASRTPPNLRGIRALNGVLSEEAMHHFRGLQPPLSAVAVARQ
jgi:hypothetical protein